VLSRGRFVEPFDDFIDSGVLLQFFTRRTAKFTRRIAQLSPAAQILTETDPIKYDELGAEI